MAAVLNVGLEQDCSLKDESKNRFVIPSMTTTAVSSPSRSAEMHPAGEDLQRAPQTPSPSPFIRKPLPLGLGLLLGLLLLLLLCFMTLSSQVAKSLAVVPPII